MTPHLSRRSFVGLVGATGAVAAVGRGLTGEPTLAAAANPVPTTGVSGRVVVVGGGMGGTSVARYLRMWGGTGLQVTLVEPNAAYTSNIMSNMVLTGQRTLTSLQYSYAALKSTYGVDVKATSAKALDPSAKTVLLGDNTSIPYDRVVLAPGIVFDALPGLTTADYDTRFPHAWQAGPQTTLLRTQLQAMKPGGTVVMTIPKAPYRCPPGPYERACLIADWVKKNKPGGKVLVLDANPGVTAEPIAFTEAFTKIHAGTITYVANAAVDHVDVATRQVFYTVGGATSPSSATFDVFNPIPPHRAGRIAQDAGLVPAGGRWVGVDVLSYEVPSSPGVHVIGDAIGTTQPKSGHMANAQAKVAADAIVRLFGGRALDPAPATSSACYSPITMSTASWLTAVFHYDPATRTMQVKSIGEAPAITRGNFSQMNKWFTGLMADTFK